MINPPKSRFKFLSDTKGVNVTSKINTRNLTSAQCCILTPCITSDCIFFMYCPAHNTLTPITNDAEGPKTEGLTWSLPVLFEPGGVMEISPGISHCRFFVLFCFNLFFKKMSYAKRENSFCFIVFLAHFFLRFAAHFLIFFFLATKKKTKTNKTKQKLGSARRAVRQKWVHIGLLKRAGLW